MWLHHSHAYLLHGQNGVGLLEQGKPDAAIAELADIGPATAGFRPAHAALARAYIAKHDFGNAAAELERVIALNPRDEEAYYRLGLIYLEQKLPEKARGYFLLNCSKSNPNSADGHAGLADSLGRSAAESRSARRIQTSGERSTPINRGCIIKMGTDAGAAPAL